METIDPIEQGMKVSDHFHFQLNPSTKLFAEHDQVKVAILSDSHSHINEQVTAGVSQCDLVVHAGDICDPNIFFELHPRENVVYAVRGNNDQPQLWSLQDQEIIQLIPEQLNIDLPGGCLSVEHGHVHGHHRPCHDSIRKAHANSKAVIYGHTHKRIFENQTTPWIINPGASGATRTHGGPGYAILNATRNQWDVELISF